MSAEASVEDKVQVPQDTVTATEVDAAEGHDTTCEQHSEGAAFDLTILVPKANFVNENSSSSKATKPSSSSNELDNYIYIFLPASGTDTVRDIKQTVAESTEGSWIGSHSFQRIVLKEEQPEKEGDEPKTAIEETGEEVYQDNVDLARVFSDERYKNPELRRVLKVVQTPYSETDARAHVLRLRDTAILGSATQNKESYNPPAYDPSSLVVDGGLTYFTTLRGPSTEETEQAPAGETAEENGQQESQQTARSSSSSKRSKGKGKARFSGKPAQSLPAIKKTQGDNTPSSKWLSDVQDPLSIHLERKDLAPHSSPLYKSLQLSVWNPPPHHLRLRGHHLYLSVTTLENETFQVTASQDGFYINRSDNHHFDPSPRQSSAKSQNQNATKTFSSLFTLLSVVSPQFASKLQTLVTEPLTVSPDFFNSMPVSNCLPAAPWLVKQPTLLADASRSQIAYLYTGSANAESLPIARDWNEELASMRELPRSTTEERLVRDRFASRFHADFQAAAARGAASIGRGEVPCLNASDPSEAKSYLVNNILFTLAQDTIDAFSHLGGHEAARVTAGKDLWAAKLLGDADIPHLHPIATAVVDYCGERWVAQAIPPGIFHRPAVDSKETEDETSEETKQEEKNEGEKGSTTAPTTGLRSVYGPANTDKPNEGYVADEKFAVLAEKIAKHFHLAKHVVKDTKGGQAELWTPADMHGVVASDGRSYVIDLYRLFPVDVNFLEQNIEGKIYSEGETIDATEEDKYSHRVTLLRSELIELYHATKTREWIEEQVKEKSAEDKPEEKTDSAKEITDGAADTSAEDFVKVDGEQAKQDEAQANAAKEEEKEQTIIDVGNFKLAFNPDAFVDKPKEPLHSAALAKPDEEEDSIKAVRAASDFLREVAIPSLLREAISDEVIPLDSSHLSQLLHKKGINIRYLGLIAEMTKQTPQLPGGQKLPESAEQEVSALLAKFKDCLLRDMVVRASKHVLRKYIAGLRTLELTQAIAHFLNCLVGYSDNSVEFSGTAAWTKITAESLRSEIQVEVRRRFRYALPEGYLDQQIPRPQLLREICLSTGIQLALRPYSFEKPSTTNGTANADKKKVNGAAKNDGAAVDGSSTFTSDDVINVYSVVKKAPFKSAMAEDFFERGQMYYVRGSLDHGEAFVSDALNFYEQIFGSVHPEMAEAYRTLANLYHRLAQPLVRRIQLYEAAANLPADREEDKAKVRAEAGFENDEAAQQAKLHYEMFLQQTVKLTRQAVVISERTMGLDSPETLQCYSDLAIFEHSVGNVELAMKLLQHSVALSNAMHGPTHPERARAAYLAASMMKANKPQSQSLAIPYYKAAQELASQTYGPNSLICANSAYQLAQCLIVDGQLSESLPRIEEALRIFETRLSKDSDSAREASQLAAAVKQAIEQRERGELAKVQNMAKKIGGDPARAKELMNKMQGSASANGKKSVNGAAATSSTNDKTGSRGHLDVDELVQFIQGGEKKGGNGAKGGNKKKSSASKK